MISKIAEDRALADPFHRDSNGAEPWSLSASGATANGYNSTCCGDRFRSVIFHSKKRKHVLCAVAATKGLAKRPP